MANLTRSAKSGSAWNAHDLKAFNIKVIREDTISFFGAAESDLPTPATILPVIWNNVAAPTAGAISDDEWCFFSYLRDAMRFRFHEQSFGIDFVRFLLGFRMLDYGPRSCILHARREIQFLMCGMHVQAHSDVALVQGDGLFYQYILLMHEDMHYPPSNGDDEPQLVADAIAAFQFNNESRKDTNRPTLESQTFPVISMVGSAAIFYKMTVTRELSDAVEAGLYPQNATIVRKFIPPVADLSSYRTEGMVPLENRRLLLKCYEAFKKFMVPAPI